MAVQALYSWEMSGTDLETIEAGFHTDNNMNKVDTALFHSLLFGVPRHLSDLDSTFEPYLDRENKQLDPISRAVLRLSTYELMFSIEVPYKVAINEAVNLAKTYGPTDSFRFINGVLDQVAAEKRAIEVAGSSKTS
jgi:N utilization substance protein B